MTAPSAPRAAVAALEETAVLARHLAAHADAGPDLAQQRTVTADWATDLAEGMRSQIRKTPDAD